MNLDLTLSSFKDKGFRITNIRKEIVRIFSQTLRPLTAREVGEMLSKLGFSANKTTIYRELQFLCANKYLVEVILRPREISYESSGLMHHHHLICDSCGDVSKVTNCLAMNVIKENIYKKKGFTIERHMLEFYGMCASCAKNIKTYE